MRRIRFFANSLAAIAIVALVTIASTEAGTVTWVGGTSGSWLDNGNWNGSAAPVNGDSLIFSGISNQINTNDRGIITIDTLVLANAGWDIKLGGAAVTIASITVTNSSSLTGDVNMNNSPSHTVTLTGTGSSLALDGTLALIRANNTTTLNVSGLGNTLMLGGLDLGNASSGRTINNSADVIVSGAVTEGRTSYFRKNGAGTLTLHGVNTYTGPTEINEGTFKLGNIGSIGNSSNISIAAGAIFDVSEQAAYTLSTNLTASGSNTTATIKGADTVSLGSLPITLTWGGASSGIDSNHPPLTIDPAVLTLNNNKITVDVKSDALGEGVYTLISAPDGITGTINTTPSYRGNGQDPGLPAERVHVTLSISNNSVILTIFVPPEGTVMTIR